jgi:hypothetical protein
MRSTNEGKNNELRKNGKLSLIKEVINCGYYALEDHIRMSSSFAGDKCHCSAAED